MQWKLLVEPKVRARQAAAANQQGRNVVMPGCINPNASVRQTEPVTCIERDRQAGYPQPTDATTERITVAARYPQRGCRPTHRSAPQHCENHRLRDQRRGSAKIADSAIRAAAVRKSPTPRSAPQHCENHRPRDQRPNTPKITAAAINAAITAKKIFTQLYGRSPAICPV